MIEMLFGLLSVSVFLLFGVSLYSLYPLVFGFLMVLIAIIDFKHLIIPNGIVIAGIASGILLNALLLPALIVNMLISAVSCLVTLAVVRFLGTQMLDSESMGLGDVKLAAVIGLFIGFIPFLLSLWIASILGLVFGLTKSLRGSHSQFTVHGSLISKIPFGSFLAISSFIVLLFKDQIMIFVATWLT